MFSRHLRNYHSPVIEDRDVNYAERSLYEWAGIVIWGLFFLLSFVGIVFALLGVSSNEDSISPYPDPTPTAEGWYEPNFDNLDQDGFINGQR